MSLSTLREIERAIATLSPEQREELLCWVEERYSQPIDLQLQNDLASGLLDDRLDRALAEDEVSTTTSL